MGEVMINAFSHAMQNAGIEPPAEIIADSILHRFTIQGDKARSSNGWYVLHGDDLAAGAFGCWKRGLSETWCSKSHQSMTPAEKTACTAKMETIKRQRKEEQERIQTECRTWCADAWTKAEYATNENPYLKRKTVNAYGLKLFEDDLIIPVQDVAGTIHGLQHIKPDGTKRFKFGTNKTGHFFKIGRSKDNTIIICEGYATGASILQATGHAVIVAFDAGNLAAVSQVVRLKFPDMKIIIAADDDHTTEGNPGLTKATEAANAVDGLLAVPAFKNPEGKSDFNDLHVAEGLKRVKEIIEAAQQPAPITVENVIADTWPEPVLFGEAETPEISSSLLPGYLGEYCHAVTRAMQTPSGLAVMLALSTVAGCLQKRFEVAPYGDNYTEPLNLWTVTALESGNRKTAVKDALTIPLVTWENEQADLRKDEIKEVKYKRDINQKRIEQLKQRASNPEMESSDSAAYLRDILEIDNNTPDELHIPRLWADDVTPERLQCLLADHNERMTLLSDEGGIFEIMAGLYSGGKANLNVFLQGHAGSPVRVDRQGRTVTLQKPALTFGLAVQPDIIADLSQGNKARFRSNGTLARFLYCIPKSTIGKRDVRQRIIIPESVKTKYCHGVLSLLNIEPVFDEQGHEQPRMLTLAPDALQQWETFSQWIESNLGENGEFFNFQDWSSKLPGAALRIAGLFHVIEYGTSSHTISLQTMESSLDLCELLTGHAKAAFDLMGEDPANIDAKHVYEWIVSRNLPAFRQNEAYRENRRFRSIERLQKALKILASRHIISEPMKRETGGRPSIWHDVTPDILKHI
jgi:putative DNA primase/helicase